MDTAKKILELEERIKKLEDILLSSSHSDKHLELKGKKISAKEFLMTKQPKTDTQKVLVFAYYLEYTAGMQSFNVVDAETVFRSAKEKLPANINDAVNKNIARGFIMEAEEKKDGKKAWYLTSTGEKFVDELSK